VLVVSAMLNLTSRDQVIPIIEGLFERWPTPEAMAGADESLDAYIAPCGLATVRAERLRHMSEAFHHMRWLSPMSVQQLPGCGRYSSDAFRIFTQRDYDSPATDAVLAEWSEHEKGSA